MTETATFFLLLKLMCHLQDKQLVNIVLHLLEQVSLCKLQVGNVISHNYCVYGVSKNCANFVKFRSIVEIFGKQQTIETNRTRFSEVYLFSTSPDLCQRTTMF